ncbi:MAG: M23 family metallopeptidase [Deltaproteobacteria bacterium]|nr:M23 family metallopeptidase [Deltaproteobacteria bacterium]
MYNKFITIVVIPQKTSLVRKFKISNVLLPFILIGALVFVIGWIWVIFDYFSERTNQREHIIKKEQFNQQDLITNQFFDEFERVQMHLNHLAGINNKLRAFTSLGQGATTKGAENSQQFQEKIEVAKKEGIINVIASDTTEINIDQIEREKNYHLLISFLSNNENPLNRIPNGWPVKGFLNKEFGIIKDPFTGQVRPHHGIDISTQLFSPIISPANGYVTFSGKDDYYGNLLIIDHGNGFLTRYGHLARAEVEKGEIVKRGRTIAQVGNTGRTTGPHLHYEVIFNRVPQNPVKYIHN